MSAATKILMAASGVDTGPIDDEFDNVSFLSHFDGSNNGTNIVYDDSSASNHTISGSTSSGSYGNLSPTQGTFGPFARPEGEWSNYFGLGGDVLTFTNDATMSWDGDFTIELFFNVATIATEGSTNPSLLLIGNIQVYLNATSGSPNFVALHVGGADIVESAADSITTSVWHHVAIVRSGSGSNNLSLYLNGTRVDQVQNTATLGASSGTSRIGNYAANPAGGINGYMSNVRILKGTALYSGSSITVPTSALTAITNTKLLTCQSNRFIDNSATGFSLTSVATPKASAFTPILTSQGYDPAVNGASAYFSGVDDAASYAANLNLVASGDSDSDFYFGTGAFTLEGWFYLNGVGHTASSGYILAFGVMMDIRNYQNSTLNFSCSLSNTAAASSAVISASTSLTSPQRINQWNHWAITRSGSNMSIFLNGTRLATVTNASGSFLAPDNNDSGATASNAKIKLGSYNDMGEYESGGYQSDFRIVKGTAVYDPTSSTCTVPTAPLTAITNTKLLLNMADGQALDSAAQNNMTLYGNADTSTTQQKFGTASLALDGTSDYLDIPANPAFAFGTGDFTVEVFIKTATSSAGDVYNRRIYMTDGPTGNANNNIQLAINPVGGVAQVWSNSGSINVNSTTSVTDDAWHHVAMVRNSGTVTLYVDGTSEGTPASYTENINLNSGSPRLRIGSYDGTQGDFNGYIDEVRVSRMARYTSNFTPSTEPFADKGQ